MDFFNIIWFSFSSFFLSLYFQSLESVDYKQPHNVHNDKIEVVQQTNSAQVSLDKEKSDFLNILVQKLIRNFNLWTNSILWDTVLAIHIEIK